jgi:Uma2 family endonuclease
MTAVQDLTLSVEEYLAREQHAEMRSEYWKGIVIPMPGGSLAHSQIIVDFNSFLNAHLAPLGHELFGEGMRIKVGEREYAYADGCIVVGKPELAFDGGSANLLNPTIIIEVLSKSTEAFDQNEKFDFYAELSSFQEYVLVSQERPYVQQFTRQADNRWLRTVFNGLDAFLTLASVPCEIPLSAIYRRVEFP